MGGRGPGRLPWRRLHRRWRRGRRSRRRWSHRRTLRRRCGPSSRPLWLRSRSGRGAARRLLQRTRALRSRRRRPRLRRRKAAVVQSRRRGARRLRPGCCGILRGGILRAGRRRNALRCAALRRAPGLRLLRSRLRRACRLRLLRTRLRRTAWDRRTAPTIAAGRLIGRVHRLPLTIMRVGPRKRNNAGPAQDQPKSGPRPDQDRPATGPDLARDCA